LVPVNIDAAGSPDSEREMRRMGHGRLFFRPLKRAAFFAQSTFLQAGAWGYLLAPAKAG
jgi:hypothetical protein